MNKIILDPATKRFGYLLERDGIILDTITKEFIGKFIPPKKEVREITSRISPSNPNESELQLWEILNEYFPYTYKYVGNFQVNIGRRFPDFININSKKEVIELFGSYYHKIEEVQQTIDHYRQYGFSCTVIWEEELTDPIKVVNHIKYGNLYTPSYRGNTIFDYRENANRPRHIDYGGLLEPHVRLMVNLAFMLMRATLIQRRYPIKLKRSKLVIKNCPIKSEKPRGRPKGSLKVSQGGSHRTSYKHQSPVEKRLRLQLRRMECRFKRLGY